MSGWQSLGRGGSMLLNSVGKEMHLRPLAQAVNLRSKA